MACMVALLGKTNLIRQARDAVGSKSYDDRYNGISYI